MLAVCNYVTSRLKLFLLCSMALYKYIWMSDVLLKEHNCAVYCGIAREKCVQHSLLYKRWRVQSLSWEVDKQSLKRPFLLWESLSLHPTKSLITSERAPFGGCTETQMPVWGPHMGCDGPGVSMGIKAGCSFGLWFSDFSFNLSLKVGRKVVHGAYMKN